MRLSPELVKIPEMAASFRRAGLTGELMGAMIKGNQERDFMADANRLLVELTKRTKIEVWG